VTRLDPRRARLPETEVTIYVGPDRSEELDGLQANILKADLSDDHRDRLQVALDELRRLNGRPTPASVDLRADVPALTGVLAEFDSAREAGTHLTALALRDLRRRARLVVSCSECQMVVALVMPYRGRRILLVRKRQGGLEPSMRVDSPFWGDVAFCRRRQHALHLADLRGAGALSVSHART
jgi:hypothetical protein